MLSRSGSRPPVTPPPGGGSASLSTAHTARPQRTPEGSKNKGIPTAGPRPTEAQLLGRVAQVPILAVAELDRSAVAPGQSLDLYHREHFELVVLKRPPAARAAARSVGRGAPFRRPRRHRGALPPTAQSARRSGRPPIRFARHAAEGNSFGIARASPSDKTCPLHGPSSTRACSSARDTAPRRSVWRRTKRCSTRSDGLPCEAVPALSLIHI